MLRGHVSALVEWEQSETCYMEDTNRHSERLQVYLTGCMSKLKEH